MATDFPVDQIADDKFVKVLVQRRSILLTIVGSTPSDNQMLPAVLNCGYLSAVKGWIEDILNKRVGKFMLIESNVYRNMTLLTVIHRLHYVTI